MDHNQNDLTQWIEVQRQTSGQLARGDRPPELHLHNHYYGPHLPEQPREPRYSRAQSAPIEVGPRLALIYVFVGSISMAVVFAGLGTVIDALNRPEVQYIQPPRPW